MLSPHRHPMIFWSLRYKTPAKSYAPTIKKLSFECTQYHLESDENDKDRIRGIWAVVQWILWRASHLSSILWIRAHAALTSILPRVGYRHWKRGDRWLQSQPSWRDPAKAVVHLPEFFRNINPFIVLIAAIRIYGRGARNLKEWAFCQKNASS